MRQPRRTVYGILPFASFVLLGLPDGMLGVAWPSIRASFGVPLDRLGLLLGALLVGQLMSSFANGTAVARARLGTTLTRSALLASLGYAAWATAPGWRVLVAASVVVGLAVGGLDAAVNTFAARQLSAGRVAWLHACYGLGGVVGSAIMTCLVAPSFSWRLGYVLNTLAFVLLLAAFGATWELWQSRTATELAAPLREAGVREALARHAVRWNALLFFVYVGIEACAGQWAFSFLSQGRGLTPEAAGFIASLYWGALTASRLLIGRLADSFSTTALARVSGCGAVLGASVLVAGGGGTNHLFGFAILGFSLGPIYPLLTAATPRRVGLDWVAQTIGFQVCAGYVGAAAGPAIAGMLVARLGFELIPVALLSATLLLLALHERIVRLPQEMTAEPMRIVVRDWSI